MPIYLDNNATTKPAPEVVEDVKPYLNEKFGNASASYSVGVEASKAVEEAREQCAHTFGCEPGELVFTAGASEAIVNTVTSALQANPERKRIVTTAVEHTCALESCKWFSEQGYELDIIGVDEHGRIDLDEIRDKIQDNTALVSVMWANNEIGNIYPIKEISEIAKESGALVHVDAVQAIGKLPVDLHSIGAIDYASFSAHKFHGLKGTGALYVRRGTTFKPLILGGHQERGRRAGTENVPGIVAMGMAAKLVAQSLNKDIAHESKLRDQLEKALLELPNTKLNGDTENRVPNTLNISFSVLEAEALLMVLDTMNVCASAGSACTTGSLEPSHVLRAMNLEEADAIGALRFSLSRYTSEEEISKTIEAVKSAVESLR